MYTYISSSILACSCGGQLVQFPGSEMVNPASSRPAWTFLPRQMLRWRACPGFPVLNLRLGSFDSSSYGTNWSGYRFSTSQENSAKSTLDAVVTSILLSRGM